MDEVPTDGEAGDASNDAPAEPEAASQPVTPAGVMPLSMPPYFDFDVEPLSVDPSVLEPEVLAPSPAGGYWYATTAPTAKKPVSRRRKSFAAALLAILLAGVIGAAIGAAAGSSSSSGPSLSRSTSANSLNAIAKTVTPAVVDIDTSVDEGAGVGESAGSGMVLTSNGEVLTNNHVVLNAATILVTITGRPRPVSATVVGVDTVHDIALLQLHGVSGLAHVRLGNSADLQVGDGVVAIGNALGLGGSPVAAGGAVSALDQSIMAASEVSTKSEDLKGLIETDAQIQPGDSGGPLVDGDGQVIGMDTAAVTSDGGPSIGFAIPINQAIGIARNIERGRAIGGIVVGLSAFLGVGVAPVTTQVGGLATTGQYVETVIPGGPAASAGVVPGDTITGVNATAITDNENSLTLALRRLKPGTTARLKLVAQGGAASTVSVVLGGIPG